MKHVWKTYTSFEKQLKEMIFQEEAIILPILLSIFHEDDWLTIAKESNAFGYVMTDRQEKWTRNFCLARPS